MRYRVYITPHAIQQWRTRVHPDPDLDAITKWVRARLKSQLKRGLDKAGSSYPLELRPGLVAMLDLNRRGPGWVVKTFIVTDRYKLPG